MSMCVLCGVFTDHEMPVGFGEIKGKTFRERRAWRQGCQGSVVPPRSRRRAHGVGVKARGVLGGQIP